MRRPGLALALGLALTAAAPFAPTTASAADNASPCFFVSQWRGWSAPEPGMLYLKVGNRDVYRVEVSPVKPSLVMNIPERQQYIPALLNVPRGNRMALTNIRERLALHFDAEASLTNRAEAGSYLVHIALPYRHRSVHP